MTAAAPTADDAATQDLPELPRKRWSGKRVTVAAIAAVLLAGAAFGAWRYFASKPHDKTAEETASDAAADKVLVYVEAPDIFVNINAGQGKSRFLKLGITLQVRGQGNAADIKTNMPRIIDNFQVYLRELRAEDLNGSAGMFLLKEELMRQVNIELAPVRIENVLFKEMLLQ
jgi:flagellar protein FliL